jgi:mycofactocin precursor
MNELHVAAPSSADLLAQDVPSAPAEDDLVEDDLLIEDVSIDGMCGVY